MIYEKHCSYRFRNFALIVEILNLITTITNMSANYLLHKTAQFKDSNSL